jgi:plasmid stabilization system protein ParE
VEAIDWYEKRRKGLGADFLRAFETTMATIERNPYQYQLTEGVVRRAALRRFPYSVMYVVSDQELLVVACFHGRRNPARWRERIPQSRT